MTMKTKKVMCFGTFDLLHLGHLNYFQQAKKYGDYLIVVIARDETKKKQNKEVLFSEEERLKLIENLKTVDEAVMGHMEDHFKIIEEKNPDVICLGYDHKIDNGKLKEKLASLNLHPEIIRAKPYKSSRHKSTLLREKLIKDY